VTTDVPATCKAAGLSCQAFQLKRIEFSRRGVDPDGGCAVYGAGSMHSK